MEECREATRQRLVVIIGGGVIGTTTAYYLTRHRDYDPALHRIIILEASSIAAAASGKAGGLLGLWAYPQCLVPLSYRLHAELAAEHGGAERWGYRRVGCGQIRAVVRAKDLNGRPRVSTGDIKPPTNGTHPPNGLEWQKLPKQDKAAASLLRNSALPHDLDWIDSKVVREYAEMGMPGHTETAQVHPFQFTSAIAALAQERGVQIRVGAQVTKIGMSPVNDHEVESVEYLERSTNQTRTISGITDVVIAAGPWTGHLLPKSQVEGLRAHSVVFKADVTPYAVFTQISLPSEWVPAHRAAVGQKRKHKAKVDPEMYARPGGEVYACGEPDTLIPLPITADRVQVDPVECDDLISYIGTVSSTLGSASISAKQACYIPRHMRHGEETLPLVGGTSVKGLWVAAGHTCWGIQNGPGTGKLMSEYIFDGAATSADISDLDPGLYKI